MREEKRGMHLFICTCKQYVFLINMRWTSSYSSKSYSSVSRPCSTHSRTKNRLGQNLSKKWNVNLTILNLNPVWNGMLFSAEYVLVVSRSGLWMWMRWWWWWCKCENGMQYLSTQLNHYPTILLFIINANTLNS